MEPGPRFEDIKIPLREPVHGLTEISGVLGTPEWWPTGSRISVVLAHGGTGDQSDPLIESLHRQLTERKYLTLRFNFPFAEAGRKRPDDLAVLVQTLRAAVAVLGRDPTSAPAHLFLGGKNLGAAVIAHLAATSRVRVEGLFFLGFPLHPQGKPEKLRADDLFRVVCPMLFVQGSRDRSCDLEVLRRTLLRVGAPTQLHVVAEADHALHVPKRSGRTDEEVQAEVLAVVDAWIHATLGG